MSRGWLVVFAKAPRPGLVKTRMSPPFSLEECAELYSEMLGDVLLASLRYAAQLESRRACWLMLKATYHPGWRVWVDGTEHEPLMVAPSFVAVPIEAGRHAVQWRYEPGWSRSLLLFLGILAVAGLHAFERRRRRRLSALA